MAIKKTKSTEATPKITEVEQQKEVFVKIQKKIQSNRGRCTLTEKLKYLSFVIQQADNNPFEISEYDIEMMLKNQAMVKKLLKANKTTPRDDPPLSKNKMLKEISEKMDATIHDLSSASSKIIESIEEKVQEAIKKLNK